MQFLRSNTAVIITVGPFYDKTDGVTIETALTIANERITLTADTDDGAAPTNILDNVTGATSGTSNDLNYITGNDAGMMQLELSAANTNRVGRMKLSITDAANHAPVFEDLFVLPAAIYDWLTGVIVPLPANVTTWLGTAAATPTVAGVPEVDVTHWIGTAAATPTVAGVPEVDVTHLVGVAQSAADLKDFADDGYDPTTNKVQGVVLTDTLTTYTGNTVQTGDSFARIGAAGASLTDLGGMSTTMKAQVQTEAEDALVTHRVDELLNADSDIDGAAPPTVGSVFHELMTKTAASFTYDQTTDALEAVRDRGDAAWITATGFSTHSAADVWAVATRTLTAFDSAFKTGYALSAAGIQAVWDALTSALTTVGSIGKLLVDNINATISSRASQTSVDTVDDFLDTEIAAIKAKTDNLPSDPADQSAVEAAILASWTTALTESYSADGVAPTPAQALFVIMQTLTEMSISSTTMTVKKLDGSTTALTLTLNDATTPTSVTRSG